MNIHLSRAGGREIIGRSDGDGCYESENRNEARGKERRVGKEGREEGRKEGRRRGTTTMDGRTDGDRDHSSFFACSFSI